MHALPPEMLLRETRVSQINLGAIYHALLEADCNISKAARALEVSPGKLRDRIVNIPAFALLLRDKREGVLDKAEDNIFADVEKGDQTASRFVLQTVGKERGYVQGVAGTGKGGEIEVSIRTFSKDTE